MLRSSQPASIGSLLAALTSSCCALPVVLALTGVSTGLISLLEPLHTFRPVFIGLATLCLGWGWATVIYRGSGVRSLSVQMLSAATLLLVAALAWRIWAPWATHVLSRMR